MRAFESHFKFFGTVAAPNQVRVRIDKSRHEDFSLGIECGFIGIFFAQSGACPDRDDFFFTNEDGTVFDDAEFAEFAPALRTTGEGEELGGGVYEHSFYRRGEGPFAPTI